MTEEEKQKLYDRILSKDFAKKMASLCAETKLYDFLLGKRLVLKDLAVVASSIRRKEVCEPAKVSYSVEDMKHLALDFYKELDKDIYDRICQVLSKEKTLVLIDGKSRRTQNRLQLCRAAKIHDYETVVFQCEKPEKGVGKNSVGIKDLKNFGLLRLVELHPADTVEGELAVAHELAHMASQRIVDIQIQRVDCLGEIEGLFIEKLFLDYLVENGIISQKDRDNAMVRHEMDFKSNINFMLLQERLLTIIGEPITAKKIKKAFERQTSESQKELFADVLKDMVDEKRHAKYVYRYVVGELVASQLYEAYKKDPEPTIQRFRQFLKENAKLDLNEAVELLLGKNYEEAVLSTLQAKIEERQAHIEQRKHEHKKANDEQEETVLTVVETVPIVRSSFSNKDSGSGKDKQ